MHGRECDRHQKSKCRVPESGTRAKTYRGIHDSSKTPKRKRAASRAAFNAFGGSSNLEGAVLYRNWRRRGAREHIAWWVDVRHDGVPRSTPQPGRRRQDGGWDRLDRWMIGCRYNRMAVRMTACPIACAARWVARRHPHGDRAGLLNRAHIRRHSQLLEQQAKERDQRNPATVAATSE